MAKIFNSICFTTLLLVVLLISAEIPKSEANSNCDKFLGEAVLLSYPCREHACEAKCLEHYHESCKGECEEHDHDDHHHVESHDDDEHCHCYGYGH
ncbi:unnamed protein product [Arabis nemorensis]|uniref:Uncharacterized protein n=1 Tax=Arabis nemorensis TaxID=586526 RepID=A0A565B668_9BRAS|nr:unnamed protein product [Arabis nemorensis]